jgi:hypothetical protein
MVKPTWPTVGRLEHLAPAPTSSPPWAWRRVPNARGESWCRAEIIRKRVAETRDEFTTQERQIGAPAQPLPSRYGMHERSATRTESTSSYSVRPHADSVRISSSSSGIRITRCNRESTCLFSPTIPRMSLATRR